MKESSPGYLFDVWFEGESGIEEDAKVADERGWSEGGVIKVQAETVSGSCGVFGTN